MTKNIAADSKIQLKKFFFFNNTSLHMRKAAIQNIIKHIRFIIK